MQGLKTSPSGKPATSLAYRLPLLGLSALLAACHIPQADSAAGEQSSAANAITTTSQAAEQAATAPDQAHARQFQATLATTAHALIEEESNPFRLDDSLDSTSKCNAPISGRCHVQDLSTPEP